jgi:hypothetical protein
VLFADDPDVLWNAYSELDSFLASRLRLGLKSRVTRISPVSQGLSFLGWRIFPGTLRLDGPRRRRLIRRFRATEKALASGTVTEENAARSMGSVVAWSRWGRTGGLRRSLLAAGGHRAG